MATHKKHHYVPRFYLKRFSFSGKSIDLFNVQSARLIRNAELKNQCYKNYFYGKDQKTESALATIEAETARILQSIKTNMELPRRRSQDYITFLCYILTQHARTAYSADQYNEQANKLFKYLMAPKMKEMVLSDEQASHIKISYDDAPNISLAMAAPCYPLLIDLEWKLIRATGTHEFVTSDNPVVFYNRFFSFRKYGSNTGLASKGLQIFFPIDPKNLLLLYDGKVYGVGAKKCEVIELFNENDVKQLNYLQFVSALENVYFSSNFFAVTQTYDACKRYRKPQKSFMAVSRGEEINGRREDLVMMSASDIRTELDLSFVHILKPAKRLRKSLAAMREQPAVVVRDRRLANDFERFWVQVKAQQYAPGDFFGYIRDTYHLP